MPNPVIVCGQLGPHCVEQRLVGKLHGPAEGIAEQLAAELPDKGLPPFGQQPCPQPVDALNLCAIGQRGLRVNRLPGRIGLAEAAHRIKLLKSKAQRVDLAVAAATRGVLRVEFDQLPLG